MAKENYEAVFGAVISSTMALAAESEELKRKGINVLFRLGTWLKKEHFEDYVVILHKLMKKLGDYDLFMEILDKEN